MLVRVQNICVAVLGLILFACVPARKFEEVQNRQKKCAAELEAYKTANMELENKNNELNAKFADMEKRIAALQNDTFIQGMSLRQLTENYNNINKTYQLLLDKNKELLSGNAEETKKLMKQLQVTQEELQRKEDALRALEKDLNTKTFELSKREARVKELESIISKKDSAVKALKQKVQDALLGFENSGLTIEQKNGKVYVSLEESLLFSSGSYTVEQKGVEVLKKLAKVLEQNTDINILVEGHTDNVPYKGSGAIKDNWDLSVMRATSVVKIITSNSKVDPKRLEAAGKGEFMPIEVANTPEARKKNRRTDVILTPKLDELLQILETN